MGEQITAYECSLAVGCQYCFKSCSVQRELFSGKHWLLCCSESRGEAQKCLPAAHFKGKELDAIEEQTTAWVHRESHSRWAESSLGCLVECRS